MAGLRDARVDKGLVRCTERDERGLSFLASMRCCWEPDLRLLLRETGGPPLSPRAVQACVDRWRRAKWVRAERVWARLPRMVAVTPQGAGMVDAQPLYKPIGESLLRHHAQVSRCRLWLSGASLSGWGPLTGWVSELDLRRALYAPPPVGSTPGHVPDGLAVFERVGEVPVEVELTVKEPSRLEPILEELATSYRAVLYFAASRVIGSAVMGASNRLVELGRIPPQRVHVLDLPSDPAVIA